MKFFTAWKVLLVVNLVWDLTYATLCAWSNNEGMTIFALVVITFSLYCVIYSWHQLTEAERREKEVGLHQRSGCDWNIPPAKWE